MSRVVVTGLGAVSACGLGAAKLIEATQTGRSGVKPISFDDLDAQRVKTAARLSETDLAEVLGEKPHRMREPVVEYALSAAREAVAQAGLSETHFGEACGVSIGSGFGGGQTLNVNYMKFGREGSMRLDPMSVPKIMNNAAASHVSMEFILKGPSFTVATACASSNHAMAQAFTMVRSGMSKVMVTGGSESMLCFGGVKAWEGLRVMSKDACRPFSMNRNGMVQGEGAGVFVIEEYEHAKKRGADIMAEIVGFAMSSDA